VRSRLLSRGIKDKGGKSCAVYAVGAASLGGGAGGRTVDALLVLCNWTQ
jgi:hypothetical protein